MRVSQIVFVILLSFVKGDLTPFGRYEMKFLSVTVDGNDKSKTYMDLDRQIIHHDNGTTSVSINAKVKKFMGVLGVKFKVFAWNEKLKKYMLSINLVFKSVCDSKYSAVFASLVPQLGDDCKMIPGTYTATIQNLNSFYHKLLSDQFVYGQYQIITDLFAAGHGRIIRSNTTVLVLPIRKTKLSN